VTDGAAQRGARARRELVNAQRRGPGSQPQGPLQPGFGYASRSAA
jgi:hypothetical protein